MESIKPREIVPNKTISEDKHCTQLVQLTENRNYLYSNTGLLVHHLRSKCVLLAEVSLPSISVLVLGVSRWSMPDTVRNGAESLCVSYWVSCSSMQIYLLLIGSKIVLCISVSYLHVKFCEKSTRTKQSPSVNFDFRSPIAKDWWLILNSCLHIFFISCWKSATRFSIVPFFCIFNRHTDHLCFHSRVWYSLNSLCVLLFPFDHFTILINVHWHCLFLILCNSLYIHCLLLISQTMVLASSCKLSEFTTFNCFSFIALYFTCSCILHSHVLRSLALGLVLICKRMNRIFCCFHFQIKFSSADFSMTLSIIVFVFCLCCS